MNLQLLILAYLKKGIVKRAEDPQISSKRIRAHRSMPSRGVTKGKQVATVPKDA